MEVEVGILCIVIILIIWVFSTGKGKSVKNIVALKHAYDTALNGNDKKVALKAGRAFHSALRRNGILTHYDEQAIANDLSTMN